MSELINQTDQIKSIENVSFIDACRMLGACVYIFMDGSTPVYVGKTANIRKRFEPYKYGGCHNVALNDWLIIKNNEFRVEIIRCENIDEVEVNLISRHKKSLFNISNGREADWYKQSRDKKPWIAGVGILSPISSVIRKMEDGNKKRIIKEWLSTLSDKQRCVEEISLAMVLPIRNKRWLSLVSGKLVACMEGR